VRGASSTKTTAWTADPRNPQINAANWSPTAAAAAAAAAKLLLTAGVNDEQPLAPSSSRHEHRCHSSSHETTTPLSDQSLM